MSKKKTKDYDNSDWFVISFCCEGLEGIIPVSQLERQETFDILAGKTTHAVGKVAHSVNAMILRARFNPQRFYEVYAISAAPGISADDIRGMFDADPQCAADIIRNRGQQLFSDRRKERKDAIV
jgi:hypothetical protein